MVWSSSGARRSYRERHPGEVKTARPTTSAKNSCANPAWLIEIGGGKKYMTVSPPSIPCAMTAARAIQPRRRTHRRDSVRESQTASPIVSMPTMLAISRWPCS